MSRLLTTIHINIGLLYSELSLLLGTIAFFHSVLFRLELSTIGPLVLFGDGHFYNSLVTAHGLIIVFGFIMPVTMGGFMNLITPILLYAPDMIFPRMNNMSMWVFGGGGVLLVLGVFTEDGIASG